MARARLFDFTRDKHKGLWISGPRDRTPVDALRRARGINAIRERQLRSRNGSTADAAIAAAHSLTRFNGVRFQGATTILNRAGVSISTGFDGTPLSFAQNEPRRGTNARFLFVAGGGKLEKVDTAGAVTRWGIAAPTAAEMTGFAGASVAPQTRTIDEFDAIAPTGNISSRTAETRDGILTAATIKTVTQSIDSSDFAESTGSLVLGTADLDGDANIQPFLKLTGNLTAAVNLTTYPSGDSSSDEDFIRFFLKMNTPCLTALDRIYFCLNSSVLPGPKNGICFTIRFDPDGRLQDDPGVTDAPGIHDEQEQIFEESMTVFPTPTDRQVLLEDLGETTFDASSETFTRFSIPKKIFSNFGSPNLAAVIQYEMFFFFFEGTQLAADSECIKVDHLHMSGGGSSGSSNSGGMQGTYRYRVTYRNSTTGNRSNAGEDVNGDPITRTVTDLDRGSTSITGLPISGDSQVDQREIWRTAGNGNRFFRIARVNDNTTTTFVDDVADFSGLDTLDGATLMTNEELPTDNDPPDTDFDDVIIDTTLTAFWISSGVGKRGRVFFSPVGRPESQRGFIDVSGDAEPLQKLVSWGGKKWAVSEVKWYEIIGASETNIYIPREVAGVPGVRVAQRRTVVATPFGIIYQAADGVRRFDGKSSSLVQPDPVLPLFRGEAGENLSAFEGTVATFARDEYIISDGSQCLAINLNDLVWRDLGYSDITALFYEADTDEIQAGRTSNVQLIEDEGTLTDSGTAISLAVESLAHDLPGDRVLHIDDVIIEADTGSQAITPTLVHKFGTITLTDVNTSARRTASQEINRILQVPGLRFTGSLSTAQATIFGAEFEFRDIQLGINRTDTGQRETIAGKAIDLTTEIEFEIPPGFRLLDELNTLYYIERIVLETDTNSSIITPIIDLESTSLTLATVSTTARRMNEISVERMGPVTGVRLQDDFTTDVQIFGVELFIRPLFLDVVMVDDSRRVQIDARSADPTTSITFDLDPFFRAYAGETFVPVIDRVVIESDTSSVSVTPSINLNEGASISLASYNTANRQRTFCPVDRVGKVNELVLTANFVTNAISIFSVEMVFRRLPLNINLLGDLQ